MGDEIRVDEHGHAVGPPTYVSGGHISHRASTSLRVEDQPEEIQRLVAACRKDPRGFQVDGQAKEAAEQIGIPLEAVKRHVLIVTFWDLIHHPPANPPSH